MKLGRWGLRPERLSLARFQRNRTLGFGESAEKWVTEAFLSLEPRTTSATFLGSISAKLTTNTCAGRWLATRFHISEKFPLTDQIYRKTVFFRVLRVPCLCPAYGSREMFCDAQTVSIPWWTSHRFILPGWLLLRDVPFSQPSTSESFPFPQCQQWQNWPIIFSNMTRQVAPRSDHQFALVNYSSAHFLVTFWRSCEAWGRYKVGYLGKLLQQAEASTWGLGIEVSSGC